MGVGVAHHHAPREGAGLTAGEGGVWCGELGRVSQRRDTWSPSLRYALNTEKQGKSRSKMGNPESDSCV